MKNFQLIKDQYVYRTAEEGPVVKVELYYYKGGANYFSGGSSRRGIFLSVRATKIEKHEGYTTESFEIFGKGGKALVKELARKSDKELLWAAEALDVYAADIAKNFEASEELGRAALLAAVKSVQPASAEVRA